jgi:hypothetical protein
MPSPRSPRPASADPRRAAAETRIQRAKRVILVASAGVGVLLWSLVAGATATTAGNVTPTQPPSQMTQPARDRFFDSARSSGITRQPTTRAPVLRSHGS